MQIIDGKLVSKTIREELNLKIKEANERKAIADERIKKAKGSNA